MPCALTTSILSKWREQQTFVRFLDGDTLNCHVENLQYVPLKAALEHIDDWKVDWDMDLSAEEVALVLDPEWRHQILSDSFLS